MKKKIDIDEIIDSGVILKKAKSYYIGNAVLLTKHFHHKIKPIETTKNGINVTFIK